MEAKSEESQQKGKSLSKKTTEDFLKKAEIFRGTWHYRGNANVSLDHFYFWPQTGEPVVPERWFENRKYATGRR